MKLLRKCQSDYFQSFNGGTSLPTNSKRPITLTKVRCTDSGKIVLFETVNKTGNCQHGRKKQQKVKSKLNIWNGTISKSSKASLAAPQTLPPSNIVIIRNELSVKHGKTSIYVLWINKQRTGTYFDVAEAEVGFGSVKLFSVTQVLLLPIVNRWQC